MIKRVPWGMPIFRTAAVGVALFAGALEAFAGGPATSTTLTFMANGSPVTTLTQGNVVTLTATVISGSTPITVGQVEFCDASPYCTDIHQLAIAQLTSAGTATFRFVPRLGTQHYRAIFLGTNSYAGSTSATQALAVTSSGYEYLSATTLAASGSPGNYTLTATVTGGGDPAVPTGTVSFLDTTNANYVLGTATLTPLVGQFSFVNSANLEPDSGWVSQTVGDFNGDGIPDIAMAISYYGPAIAILLGNGDGTFTQSQTITLPYPFDAFSFTSPIGVADVNGDGIADLVFEEATQLLYPNPTTEVGYYQVALGHGDGTFTLLPPVALPAEADDDYNAFTVGDFNNDGKPDLLVTNVTGATYPPTDETYYLWFFAGNGDGTFASPTVAYELPHSAATTCSRVMVAADFNEDGNLDLICSDNQSASLLTNPPAPPPGNTVSVLLGNGNGTFTLGSSLTVGPSPSSVGPGGQVGVFSIAVADFNGDGKADLAVSGTGSVPNNFTYDTNFLVEALGNGDGTFAAATPLPTLTNIEVGLATGDFNGDGFPDLAVAYDNSAPGGAGNLFTVQLGHGDGTFSENDVPVSFSLGPYIFADDFNLDGRWDVAILEQATSTHPEVDWGVFLSQPTSATATVTGISPVGTGIHLVDASYPGIPAVLSPSLSNTVGLQAEPVPTTLMLLAAPTTGVFQQPFSLAATIAPTSAQNHTPTGSVTFYNGAVRLGTSQVNNDVASVIVSAGLPAGTYTLTATYSGDANFNTSTASLQYVVSAVPSFITFTVPNHIFGDPPFTVAATSASPGAFTYSVLSGPATISGSTVTLTGAGAVVLQASQAASGGYTAGTQNAIFGVAQEQQTITFPAPPSPVNPTGPAVVLSATASSGLPVTFSVLSGPATISGSMVSFTGPGTVVVAATQSGNTNIAPVQATHTILVVGATPAVTLGAMPGSVFLLAPVTLTATVSSPLSTPTGSVVFSSGSTVLGTGTLNTAGLASITVSTLPLGSDPIVAAYGGDPDFKAATSPMANVNVQDFTLTVTAGAAQTIQYGGAATFALSVTPINGATIPSAINFALSGYPAGSTITFSPASLAAGSGGSNIALVVQVPQFIAASPRYLRGPAPALAALVLCGSILPSRRRRRFAGRVGCILLLLAAACASTMLTGCGNGVIFPLTQTFSVNVSASSGALSHTAATTLTVN